MTVWFKRLLVVAAILVAVLVLLVTIGPREKVVARFEFDPMVIGTDVDAYLAEREAPFPDITPGTEKRVVWAGEVGEKTPISVLYFPPIGDKPPASSRSASANLLMISPPEI